MSLSSEILHVSGFTLSAGVGEVVDDENAMGSIVVDVDVVVVEEEDDDDEEDVDDGDDGVGGTSVLLLLPLFGGANTLKVCIG